MGMQLEKSSVLWQLSQQNEASSTRLTDYLGVLKSINNKESKKMLVLCT